MRVALFQELSGQIVYVFVHNPQMTKQTSHFLPLNQEFFENQRGRQATVQLQYNVII